LQPHTTSEYGAIRKQGTSPHRGVDANYKVGPNGQTGINLQHPAVRAPVDGTVINAREGTVGSIAIRDANGLVHEILHTHGRYVSRGDPVVAGQIIGTMGNMGVNSKGIESGDHHAHFQIKDSAGNHINPTAYWNQRGPIDPNPAPPTFLNEHQRYLRRVDQTAGNTAAAPIGAETSMPFGTGGQFAPGSATSSRPLYETRSFVLLPPQEAGPVDTGKNFPRLVRMPARKPDLAGFDPNAPAAVPNEIPPAGRPTTFDDRFGNWRSLSGVGAPLAPNQPVAPPPAGRPLGIVSGQPMPDYPFPLPIFGFPGKSSAPGDEDWAWSQLRRADWDKRR